MNSTTRSGFLPDRTVHLHATRLCNLECRHCYSSSSPRARETLSLALLEPALAFLRDEGYEVLSLSGGEPLMYAELPALASRARGVGFKLVAVSNGYRVRPRFDALVTRLDGVAISFDGLGDVHDRMRGRAKAYDVAIAALRHLRTRGIPAAAAYTVTRESLRDIPEFVEQVIGCGVRAIQLRPLVMAGRATERCDGEALATDGVARLYLIGPALAAAYLGTVGIHTDLAWSEAVVECRGDYRQLLDGDASREHLADLVNPLVIVPDGTLKPFTYDFPSDCDLGSITDLTNEGTAQIETRRIAPLRQLVDAAFAELGHCEDFIDWFAYCRDMGTRPRAPVAGSESHAPHPA